MKVIRKYTGHDMSEIMQKIKLELGKDALILNTVSKSRKFFPGLIYEVSAGLLEEKKPANTHSASVLETLVRTKEKVNRETHTTIEFESLHKGLADIKSELKLLKKKDSVNGASTRETNIHLELIQNILFALGMDMVLWKKIQQALPKVMSHKALSEWEYKELIEKIHYLYHIAFQKIKYYAHEHSNVHCFVGPTGSGKTTTIAKFASRQVIEHKKKVVMVSLDQFRLGGADQLKKYADILRIPFYSIEEGAQLKSFISQCGPDIEIFIDTSGTSPRGREHFLQLCAYTGLLPEKSNIYLTLPSTLSRIEIENVITRFKQCLYNQTILTKVDEAFSLVHLLGLRFIDFPGVSYYTDGQIVPDDLHRFSSDHLSQKIRASFVQAQSSKSTEMVS